MAPVDSIIETAQGESSIDIYWLPGLTLGYIYYLSGVRMDFILAVLALLGARHFHDLSENLRDEQGDLDLEKTDRIFNFSSRGAIVSSIFLGSIKIIFVFTVYASLERLSEVFTHQDLILVGLSLAYFTILAVVVTQLIRAVILLIFGLNKSQKGSPQPNR